MTRTTSILLFCCLLCCFVESSNASRFVKLTQYTTEDGLKQNNVLNLQQDSEGFIWISTSEGLSRFDGHRMSSIDSPGNILELYGSELVWQDSNGLIWIGALPENNYQLDIMNNKLTQLKLTAPKNYKLEYPTILKIVEDSKQNLWMTTYREIFFYNRTKNTISFVSSLDDFFEYPRKEHIFRDLLLVDNLLVLATTKGAFSFNPQTKQTKLIKHSPKDIENEDQNNTKSLVLNKNNRLLIGTVEGLYFMDAEELKKPTIEQVSQLAVKDLNIWKIIEKHDYYWLATNDGLYKLSDDWLLEHIFRFSDTPFSTSDDDIVTMIEDIEGSLWFGTNGDGVFKWRPNRAIEKHWWSKGDQEHKLINDVVNGIEVSDTNVWVATNNGLTEIDRDTGKSISHIVNPDDKAIFSASTIYSVTRNDGKLWINSDAGIQVYDENNMQRENIIFPETKEKIFSQSAIQLYFVSPTKLAIIKLEGLYYYDLTNNSISFIESSASQGDFKKVLYGFYDTPTGVADSHFLAGVDKLLTFSENTNKITTFHQIKNDSASEIYAGDLYRDKDQLWLTYPGHGVYLLNAKTGEELKYFSEKMLGANSVMDIFPDKLGNIWFATNDGLLRMNQLNYQVTKFDRRDGFATSEFMLSAKKILSDGKVLLGSVKGLYLFDPNKIHEREVNTRTPIITNVSMLSSTIDRQYSNFNDGIIEMGHEDFGLKVEFSAMLLDKPEQVKYFYQLLGSSNIKKTPIGKSELFLSRLPVGEHILHVTAIDYRNGLESEPAVLTIVSHPAWWFSRVAILTYVLLFLLFAVVFAIQYRRKLRAKAYTHNKIRLSEERLNLALKASKSGLWDWHAIGNVVYEPRLANTAVEGTEKTVPFKQRFEAIHYRDQKKVTARWRSFLKGETEVFEVRYRMKNESGSWHWYRDIAMISMRDENDNPARVTGTFTDISEIQEAGEKTRLYSSAFENTLDIIVILDRKRKVIASNKALVQITGWTQEQIIGKNIDDFIFSIKKESISNKIFEDITHSKQWNGEALLKNKRSVLISVIVSATLFIENETEQFYVFSISDISKQKEAEQELKKLINFDPLTNLPNRALLLDRVTHAIPHCKRYNKRLAVFFVDLDRFKQINDTLGHDAGDLLLITAANILKECCRDDDTVARIGGDEFVVMLEDVDSVSAINRVLQNILEKMKAPIQLGRNQITISASIGVSIYPQDAGDAATLLKHADIAMYHAKNKGGNCFQYFQDYMNRAAKHRLSLENKIRSAVVEHEFSLVYQPLFDIKSGHIRGVEALARWHTSSGELIPPSNFIPLAEELGLIIPMTEKLIRDALDNVTRWNSNGNELVLAFNISSAHIYHKSFIRFIDSLVQEYPETIKYFEIELTESILMEDVQKARLVFEKLDEYGIELALDDFGTGYSSLKYLSRLPISKLKIDMSFVQHIGTSFENDAVIETIISLAKSLKLKTVAEGIEDENQFDFLKNADVDFAQGYLFSKPVTAVELEKIFGRNIYSIVENDKPQPSVN